MMIILWYRVLSGSNSSPLLRGICNELETFFLLGYSIDKEGIFKKAFAKDKSNKGKNEGDSIKNLMLSDEERNILVYDKIIKIKEREMSKAVKELDFETAAILRDEIVVLKGKVVEK